MSTAPASDNWPMLSSWVRISEPFASHLQKLEVTSVYSDCQKVAHEWCFQEDEVYDTSQLSTFPTDQVPQPVTRVCEVLLILI